MMRNTLTSLISSLVLVLSISTLARADDIIILEDLPEGEDSLLVLPEPDDTEEVTPADADASMEASTTEEASQSEPEPAEDTGPASVAPQAEPETADATPDAATDEPVKVNVVNVNETFFRITTDPDSGSVIRTSTQEAKPGDVIEIVISATNASDETLRDVELTNSVPTGPLIFQKDTIDTDLNNGLYRFSSNGNDFFPAEADVSAESIRFIQWVIFTLPAEETATFRYRIQINPSQSQ